MVKKEFFIILILFCLILITSVYGFSFIRGKNKLIVLDNTNIVRSGGGGSYTTADYVFTDYVNLTSNNYTGLINYNGILSYDGANKICGSEFTGTHLCNEFEITDYERYYNMSSISGVGWVISGGSKYTPVDHPVNDCNGFTNESTDSLAPMGSFWNFNEGYGVIGNCGVSKPLTCCK